LYSETLRKNIVPALVGAGICLFFQHSGFFSLFFLVPLGVVAYRYNYRVAWGTFLIAVLGNVFFALVTAAFRAVPLTEAVWDILYFAVMALLFTWVIAPPPGFTARVSGSIRLMIGSCLGALLFTGIFFRMMASPDFSGYLNSAINTLVSLYRSSGSDVVQNALLDSLSADMILNAMKSIMLRGGSLVSCVLLFFICRQISLAIVRLFMRRAKVQAAGSLMGFHVYPVIIWVLSVSLLLVVVVKAAKLEIPEIILWNILVFCVILYLAQGLGILQFFFVRPSMPPFLRLILLILFFVLLFSPGINAVLLGGVVLLGIAENWVPFRAPKTNGQTSTPESGGGGN